MRRVAIYDLDGTVLRRATFTPFLLFAARRHEPWRLCLAPIWVGAMVLYRLGLFSRRALKQFGLRLFLGRRMTRPRLDAICDAFAARAVQWASPDAMQAMTADRADGATLILATAAMEFYAGGIARRLNFDHLLGTRIRSPSDAPFACVIEGENCYAEEKPERVAALFHQLGWDRSDCMVRFYTDSTSDAPLLDWADEAVLVNTGRKGRAVAAAHGWKLARFG